MLEKFYIIYKKNMIAIPLVTQLSWINKLLIISSSKTKEKMINNEENKQVQDFIKSPIIKLY